jgi:hypothetical protein
MTGWWELQPEAPVRAAKHPCTHGVQAVDHELTTLHIILLLREVASFSKLMRCVAHAAYALEHLIPLRFIRPWGKKAALFTQFARQSSRVAVIMGIS